MTGPETVVRRSRHLVAHFVESEVELYNYARRCSHRVGAYALQLLGLAHEWVRVEELEAGLSPSSVDVVALVDELLRASVLMTLGAPREEERALERWQGWNPAAGFLHFSTKDVSYAPHNDSGITLKTMPQPAPYKGASGGQRQTLPPFQLDGGVSQALLRRRTWRRFGEEGIRGADLSALLGLTFGVQKWVDSREGAPVPLKTSPSGGARHSLEAYVLARSVEGLPPGTYHYDGNEHSIELLRSAPSSVELEEMLPTQYWFHEAAAIVFLTSVFARIQWRYPFARAYRVLHLEAGHFGQSFCLLATSLGLAPFSTAALGDTAIERHLGIDGIGESVLYALGVGPIPRGLNWAPDPDSDRSLPTSDPLWRQRSARSEPDDRIDQ